MRLLERLEGDFRPQERGSCNIVGTLAAIGLGIAGAAGVASSAIGAHAAGSAADAQAAAANNAANLQHQDAQSALDFNKLQYGNSLNLISPYVNTGTSALNRLSFLMGMNPQQGLPPGVINPNQPAGSTGTAGFSRPNFSDFNGDALMRAGGRGIGAGDSAFSAAGSTIPRFMQLRNAANATGGAQVPFTNPDANNFGMNGTPGAGTTGGFQNPDTLPGAWPGLNGAAGTGTVANGLPGMVPRTDGGGTPGAPGTADPNSGFGSLAQGFNEQFQAPTDVTEQNDPGYKFRLQQGTDALQRSAAARGGLLSGGTAKDINDYAQNSASNEYGNVYNRTASEFERRYNIFKQNQNDLFNRYATLSGIGQTSAGQLSSAGLNSAGNATNILLGSGQQIGNSLQNAGSARASGYVGAGNAISGGVSGIGGLASLLALMKQNPGGQGV